MLLLPSKLFLPLAWALWLLLAPGGASAQGTITCEAYLLSKKAVAAKLLQGVALTAEEAKDKTPLLTSESLLTVSDGIDHVALKKEFIVLVFLKDGAVINIGEAPLTLNGITCKPSNKTVTNKGAVTDKGILLKVEDCVNDDVQTGATIELAVQLSSGTPFKFFFRMQNKTQHYGATIIRDALGVWVPLNLYSGSLARSENGVRFTAMPVNIALGGKIFTSKDFYWGGSVTGNYTVASARKEDTSVLVSALSWGLLLDMGGYGYLGYSFPVNLDKENPLENQIVAGITIKLGELIKKK